MLHVGLTGGIGAGKSTVSGRLAELGAALIDSDRIAREVLEPGSEGLAQVVAEFGAEVLTAEGALDRPALARRVFGDERAREALNAIVHPRVGARTAELVAQAPADAVLVHDVPLLVENGMAARFQLVVVVHAEAGERVRRLVEQRGMAERDAWARVEAQADDEQRRAAADVWLDNSGEPGSVLPAVDWLWSDRLLPFERNLRTRTPAPRGPARLVHPDPTWPTQARRLAARVAAAAGERGVRVDHIGSTAVPGLLAKDVLDLQLSVTSLADADALRQVLEDAGFPCRPKLTADRPKPEDPDPERWRKRVHVSADPGRPANLHVRAVGSPGWRYALLLRDWLRADEAAREEYAAMKRASADAYAGDRDHRRYAEAKEPWFDAALARAQRWAAYTGWTPPAG